MTGELLQIWGVLSHFLFLCQVSLGAKLRMRRAKLLQIWAFAICKVQKFWQVLRTLTLHSKCTRALILWELPHIWAFAICQEEYQRSTRLLDNMSAISVRYLKYVAALAAYLLQVKYEGVRRTHGRAALHFRGWWVAQPLYNYCYCVYVYIRIVFLFLHRLLRASLRGWVAYVAELYRGLEAASMSAKYRAIEAINIWRCSNPKPETLNPKP